MKGMFRRSRSRAVVTVSVLAALSGVAACLMILMLAPTVTVIGYELLGYRHAAEALSIQDAGLSNLSR